MKQMGIRESQGEQTVATVWREGMGEWKDRGGRGYVYTRPQTSHGPLVLGPRGEQQMHTNAGKQKDVSTDDHDPTLHDVPWVGMGLQQGPPFGDPSKGAERDP